MNKIHVSKKELKRQDEAWRAQVEADGIKFAEASHAMTKIYFYL